MRAFHLLSPVLPLLALAEAMCRSPAQAQTADVAVAPFAVSGDSGGIARAAADSSLEQLVAGLKAKGITVSRLPNLTEKTLSSAKPARWAVLGEVTRDKGQMSAELRLMEVATSDEMVSYFNSGNAQAIATLGGTAAGRIATYVKEKKGVK